MKIVITLLYCVLSLVLNAQQFIDTKPSRNNFQLRDVHIYVHPQEVALIHRSAKMLQEDIFKVSGKLPVLVSDLEGRGGTLIVLGTHKRLMQHAALSGTQKGALTALQGSWEAYAILSGKGLKKGYNNTLIIAGSDRRGLAYGVLEFSSQIGVSPWYWWADVPVLKRENIFIRNSINITDKPKVKYRGIFINDEAPALSGWAHEKFGGFNSAFYEKVFELILRLKGNYLWPAMWGNAFYADDSLSIHKADEYGIVIGTSHHEPLMRAHDEWRRFGSGEWNYETNKEKLQQFWRRGMTRAWNEKIVSVGMRGDGDEPMTRETATALLEKIVEDQRKIIAETTGKPADKTPQLWALYKEVLDYYDKGMRVPDDITLLLCDDNWGNIRRLPAPDAPPRAGGYGIYYHFDYVGGPRNYKWINTNPLPRIWEQMHLAWAYKAREIWIVNVGDIKPMELPASFFLHYAWDPERTTADSILPYTRQWAAQQFGEPYAEQIARLLSGYAKYNARRKPELLDANTFSFNYQEWPRVVMEYKQLLQEAMQIDSLLPMEYKYAYFQLVLHPIKAMANLYELYYMVALNREAYKNNDVSANTYADKAKELYRYDSLITLEYHRLNGGKWNHMMSQTHIGYTYWQQPPIQVMPVVYYVSDDSAHSTVPVRKVYDVAQAGIPEAVSGNVFYEDEEIGVSIQADHYTRAINSAAIQWKVLPDLGRTGSAITSMPVTASQAPDDSEGAYLEYDFYSFSTGDMIVNGYFSPTLNFLNAPEGLQFALSVDDSPPQVISLNGEDKTSDRGIWNKWAAENIIIKSARFTITKPGKHTLRYRMISPGVVLQQFVLDFGRLKPSYLGPPETLHNKKIAQ